MDELKKYKAAEAEIHLVSHLACYSSIQKFCAFPDRNNLSGFCV